MTYYGNSQELGLFFWGIYGYFEQFIKEHTCHVQGVNSDSPWGIRTCSYEKEGSTMGVLFKGVLINKNGILR